MLLAKYPISMRACMQVPRVQLNEDRVHIITRHVGLSWREVCGLLKALDSRKQAYVVSGLMRSTVQGCVARWCFESMEVADCEIA